MEDKREIAVKDFNFSYGKLLFIADVVKGLVGMDIALLSARGVTETTILNLGVLIDNLRNTRQDHELRGLITEAVEIKNAARDAALKDARILRTAAQNKFGEGSPKYNRFRFENINNQREAELPRDLRSMQRVGVKLLPAFEGEEGITPEFLAAFLVKINAIDDAMENVRIAEEDRDQYTEERVTSANILYKEIVRLCNIGKSVFEDLSHAKYKNYVIAKYIGRRKAKPALEGTLQPGSFVNVPLKNETIQPFTDIELSNLPTSDAGSEVALAFRTSPTAPYDAELSYLVATTGETAMNAAAQFGYNEATGSVHLMLYNNSAGTVHYKIDIER